MSLFGTYYSIKKKGIPIRTVFTKPTGSVAYVYFNVPACEAIA